MNREHRDSPLAAGVDGGRSSGHKWLLTSGWLPGSLIRSFPRAFGAPGHSVPLTLLSQTSSSGSWDAAPWPGWHPLTPQVLLVLPGHEEASSDPHQGPTCGLSGPHGSPPQQSLYTCVPVCRWAGSRTRTQAWGSHPVALLGTRFPDSAAHRTSTEPG